MCLPQNCLEATSGKAVGKCLNLASKVWTEKLQTDRVKINRITNEIGII